MVNRGSKGHIGGRKPEHNGSARLRVSATELSNGICESGAEWPSLALHPLVWVTTANGHFAMFDKDAQCDLFIIERAKNGHNSTLPARSRPGAPGALHQNKPTRSAELLLRLADW